MGSKMSSICPNLGEVTLISDTFLNVKNSQKTAGTSFEKMKIETL